MTNIVLDTNVIVSAALSPEGSPAKVIRLIAQKSDIKIFYTTSILHEYRRVLSYEKIKIDEATKNRAINLIQQIGFLIEPTVSTIPLPDESDRVFYDTAKASKALLITGNIKHYPTEDFILTPRQFLTALT